MFKEISLMLYGYISDAEMIFLEFYKLNPIEIIKNMPLMDLPSYIKKIQQNKEKEKNKFKNNNTFMQALHAICEYLNFIFYKDRK